MSNLPNHEFKNHSITPQYAELVPVQASIIAAVALAHSLYVRGVRRTLLFAGFSLSLAGIAEAIVINGLRMLRHHTEPQFKGVPLGAVLGWYNIGYASFALMERLIEAEAPATQRRVLPWATAATATSLDLLMDCMGLEQGLWEWSRGGIYARDIKGSNGKSGIPLVNFLGWLVLTSGVVLLYLWAAGRVSQPIKQTPLKQGITRRWAALLLLPYYGAAVVWAVRRRKFRYLLYSLLVPIALLIALRDEWSAKLQSRIHDLE